MTTRIDTIQTAQHTHTPCYCEENVYNLISDISKHPDSNPRIEDAYVIFISNDDKKVPIWGQRASTNPLGLVIWDYHVVLLSKSQTGQGLIYDLDSILPFPSTASAYIQNALQDVSLVGLPSNFQRLYRVVPAVRYLRHFASDRSHMLLKEEDTQEGNGGSQGRDKYHSPPPQYNAIVNALGERNTLPRYLDMGLPPEGLTGEVGEESARDPPEEQGGSKSHIGDGGGGYGFVLTERQFKEFCLNLNFDE